MLDVFGSSCCSDTRSGGESSSPLDSSATARWRDASRRGSLVPDMRRVGDMGEGMPKNMAGDIAAASPRSLLPPWDSEEAESSLEPGADA